MTPTISTCLLAIASVVIPKLTDVVTWLPDYSWFLGCALGFVSYYLLAKRQDQFARAMTHKLAAYALGRPLTFGDRSQVDRITTDLRKKGDGLADLVFLIVKSDLFQLN